MSNRAWYCRAVAGVVALSSVFAAPANAQTTYTFSGHGTGFFGTTSFFDAFFEITLPTVDAPDHSLFGNPTPSTIWAVESVGSSLELDGGPSNFLLEFVYVFANNACGTGGCLGFGGAGVNSDRLNFHHLLTGSTYDLSPGYTWFDANPENLMSNVETSGGVITFTSVRDVTFSSGPAGVTASPEPASMTLLGTGLAGIAVVARRRRRSASLLS